MRTSRRHHDITPAQCRAARALLGLTQPELGTLSGLSRDVIVRLERGAGSLHYTTPGLVEAALASRGVTLVRDEMGVGVRLERDDPVSPDALSKEIISAAQSRAARALLDISTSDLATRVRMNKLFINALERDAPKVDPARLKRVRAHLVVSGIVFTNEKSCVAVQRSETPLKL